MGRRSAEQTRRLVLDAAMELLLQRGPVAGVQHIRLQEVLANVGLTTGAGYAIWSDQEAFHRELAIELVRTTESHPTMALMTAVDGIDDLMEIARIGTQDYALRTSLAGATDTGRSTLYLTALALRTAANSVPELRAAAADRHQHSITTFGALYHELIERCGWRVREPFTVRDLAEALAALAEGFAIRAAERLPQLTYQVALGSDEEKEWTLLGVSIYGILSTFVEPAPDADDAPGADSGPSTESAG